MPMRTAPWLLAFMAVATPLDRAAAGAFAALYAFTGGQDGDTEK